MKKNGNWTLKRTHAYFYQVQIQMKVCAVSRCEFVVWTKSGITLESIQIDHKFLDEAIENVTTFFKYGILPEVVGNGIPENQ